MTGSNGFGADVIQLLLPHRRPFLMVDRVSSYSIEEVPELCASRLISVNEPVFEGHFPGLSLWPGVYTIEGMGQSSMLLAVLVYLFEGAAERGVADQEVRDAIRKLDRSFHLRPGHASGPNDELIAALGSPTERLGMASKVDVKLVAPVFAGQRLDYTVRLTRHVGHVMRFDVEASVDELPVARGTLGSAHALHASPRS